eukprot:6480746-Amphidinium_carterae.1
MHSSHFINTIWRLVASQPRGAELQEEWHQRPDLPCSCFEARPAYIGAKTLHGQAFEHVTPDPGIGIPPPGRQHTP